jgi:MtN3 and saliva related transmembrane protein
MPISEWVGFVAGAISIVALFPQLRETYKAPQATGLSFTMCALNFSGMVLWALYGILTHAPAVVIVNTTMLLLWGGLCVLKMCGRKRHQT